MEPVFYVVPLWLLVGAAVGVSMAAGSPLVLSFWLTSLTGVFAFLVLGEGSWGGGVLLYLVEESLACWVLLVWFLGGGGAFLWGLLFVKGAFAPLHKWLVEVLKGLKSEVFVWGMTVHKMPVVFLFGTVVSFWSSILLLFSFVWGVFAMLSLGETRSLLVLSSSNTLVLVVLLFVGVWWSAILFLFLYIGLFWSSWVLSGQSIESVLILLGAGGVPPFLFLQMKWHVFYFLFMGSEAYPVFLALFSGAAAVVYIRFIMFFESAFVSWGEVSFLGFWVGAGLFVPAF